MYLVSRGSKTYAYRSVRDGKKVGKVYLGGGACAREMMAMQELSRSKALARGIAEAEEEAKLWPLRQRMGLFAGEAKQGLEALYYAAGFYRSQCRHWRRRKMDMDKTPQLTVRSGGPESTQPVLTEDRKAQLGRNDRLRSLCAQIKAGKSHVRSQLRELLREEDPADIKRIADLTELIADRWASKIAPNSEVARASIVIDAMDHCRALAPPGSTAVEKILADRVVLSRLQQTYHELTMTAVVGDVDTLGTAARNALEKSLQVATRELADATKNYQKGIELSKELQSPGPQTDAAALKIYNPNSTKRKSA